MQIIHDMFCYFYTEDEGWSVDFTGLNWRS